MSGSIKFDPDARKALYDKYAARMYSVCMRYANSRDSANDIFQQGFYLVYKNMEHLKNVKALSGWIKTIFVNAALDHNRKARQSFFIEEHQTRHENSSENWNNAISNLGTEELTRLIQQLPRRCRIVFNMYVIDGFSHKEIAEKLTISVGTSKSQLHDARKILKQKITTNAIIKMT